MGHTQTIIDGVNYPSVTEIIGVMDKPFLYRWYGTHGWEKCETIKKESQERGTLFHSLTEYNLRKKFNFPVSVELEKEISEGNVTEEISSCASSIIKWGDAVGLQPTEFERHVVSRAYLYGGTFDCVGFIKGLPTIFDWKLTNQISETYILQMAGYYQAYQEETGTSIHEARVIRPYILKTPAKETKVVRMKYGFKYSFKDSPVYVEERRYRGLDYYFKVFQNCREVWDFINREGMWRPNVSTH